MVTPFQRCQQSSWNWNEQYLVQALLSGSDRYEVLWAGHYVQRLRPELHQSLPLQTPGALASSLWLRKRT